MSTTSHHNLRQILLARIQSGEWALGALIPNESELAEEYGCARTTVNRALQTLAGEGLLIRKRKGGTRVCSRPVRKAKFDIPIIREQVTETGAVYSHDLLLKQRSTPSPAAQKRLGLNPSQDAVHLKTLHKADDRPFAYENRWINLRAVPQIMEAPLLEVSANEWLVQTVPFSNGEVTFSAVNADEEVAAALGTEIGAALFVVERRTWLEEDYITTMTLIYREGYQLYSKL